MRGTRRRTPAEPPPNPRRSPASRFTPLSGWPRKRNTPVSPGGPGRRVVASRGGRGRRRRLRRTPGPLASPRAQSHASFWAILRPAEGGGWGFAASPPGRPATKLPKGQRAGGSPNGAPPRRRRPPRQPAVAQKKTAPKGPSTRPEGPADTTPSLRWLSRNRSLANRRLEPPGVRPPQEEDGGRPVPQTPRQTGHPPALIHPRPGARRPGNPANPGTPSCPLGKPGPEQCGGVRWGRLVYGQYWFFG